MADTAQTRSTFWRENIITNLVAFHKSVDITWESILGSVDHAAPTLRLAHKDLWGFVHDSALTLCRLWHQLQHTPQHRPERLVIREGKVALLPGHLLHKVKLLVMFVCHEGECSYLTLPHFEVKPVWNIWVVCWCNSTLVLWLEVESFDHTAIPVQSMKTLHYRSTLIHIDIQ